MKPSGKEWFMRSLLLALLATTASSAALGGDKGMVLKVMVEQEVTIATGDGKRETKRVPASRIVPGDEVIYTIHYLNSSGQPAEKVFITIPVAEHTSYRNGSARGADTDISFSVDGGKHFAAPEELSVELEDGSKRPATASDYTHIKWKFRRPVPAGARGAVSYRAVLN